jgi:hypothetical protein
MEDKDAQEQRGAEQQGGEMCGVAEEQARSGREQENSGGDGERAADGIPRRSGDGENVEVLQGEAGEGKSEQDASAGEDAGHWSSGFKGFGTSGFRDFRKKRGCLNGVMR